MRSKVVGESENCLASLFSTARTSAPCVLLIEQVLVIAKIDWLDAEINDQLLHCRLTPWHLREQRTIQLILTHAW